MIEKYIIRILIVIEMLLQITGDILSMNDEVMNVIHVLRELIEGGFGEGGWFESVSGDG